MDITNWFSTLQKNYCFSFEFYLKVVLHQDLACHIFKALSLYPGSFLSPASWSEDVTACYYTVLVVSYMKHSFLKQGGKAAARLVIHACVHTQA